MKNIGGQDKLYHRYENDLERINYEAEHNASAFIARTEAAFHRDIRRIAETIASSTDLCKVIMLAGPSSSGKTTTAHILLDALRECGIGSQVISLDNFYKAESDPPLLENGQHPYESVEALNVPLLERCLLDLMETNTCDMPVFDFENHCPHPYTRRIRFGEREIAVVEGIHALNPAISRHLPEDGVLKIYISVKQGFEEQGEAFLSPNQVRLVRRLVRDSLFRNTQPGRTLDMWDTVMDGERKYIKPYRGEADVTINSLHCYEPCVMRAQALPLLERVDPSEPYYPQACELADCLRRFTTISQALVPKTSLLREFIGGGVYGE